MAKRRVYQVAKDRGLSSRELIAALRGAGIDVASPSSAVDERAVTRALEANGATPLGENGDFSSAVDVVGDDRAPEDGYADEADLEEAGDLQDGDGDLTEAAVADADSGYEAYEEEPGEDDRVEGEAEHVAEEEPTAEHDLEAEPGAEAEEDLEEDGAEPAEPQWGPKHAVAELDEGDTIALGGEPWEIVGPVDRWNRRVRSLSSGEEATIDAKYKAPLLIDGAGVTPAAAPEEAVDEDAPADEEATSKKAAGKTAPRKRPGKAGPAKGAVKRRPSPGKPAPKGRKRGLEKGAKGATKIKPPKPKPPKPAKPALPAPEPVERPGVFARYKLRRQVTSLRSKREGELSELGGLVLDLYQTDAKRDRLVRKRLDQLKSSDEELRKLETLLGEEQTAERLCPSCGSHSSGTRVCLSCGHALPAPAAAPQQRMSIPAAIAAVVLIAGAWLLGGFGSNKDEEPRRTRAAPVSAQPPAAPQFRYVVAKTKKKHEQVSIYKELGDKEPFTKLSNPNVDGAPLVFLVRQQRGSWLKVMLPMRPNGSVGWIKDSRVTLAGHNYSVLINLAKHRMTVRNGKKIIDRIKVGVGRAVTPTPPGLYFITELLKQPDPSGVYGPYAFGLSAYSNVLFEFAGADGILGFHGTNEPELIGTDVSHGCIRMTNEEITRLAKMLPTGTPVRIKEA